MLTNKFSRLYRLLFVCLLAITFAVSAFAQGSSSIVISQVYGGGGNTSAPYKNDFVELFNRGSVAVNVTGWSVQYASATGTTWQVTNLNGTIQPGQYYLVQEGAGTGSAPLLPTADALGVINMSGTGAKVAVVSSTTALAGNCPAGVVDFVGYGTTPDCFEGGGRTPAPSNTTSVIRASNGCTDTDNNSTDFTTGAPAPRNTASAINLCAGPTNPSGVGLATPSTVDVGTTTLLTVAVTPGSNPTSTGIVVWGLLGAIDVSDQQFWDDGTHGDAVAGDNIYSLQVTIPNSTALGAKTLTATITDSKPRNASATINLTVTTPPAFSTIRQIRINSATWIGNPVQTTGVVTGRRSVGYYIQDRLDTHDGTNSTAIFVFTGGAPPAGAIVGHELTVRGTVAAYSGDLELTNSSIDSDAGLVAMPTPVALVPDATQSFASQFAKYAGMLVRMVNPKVVAPTDYNIFYVTDPGSERPFREPGLAPGVAPLAGAGANVPSFDGNPELIAVDMTGCTNPANYATGDTVAEIVSPLGYSSTANATLYACFTGNTTKEAAPLPAPGTAEFTIASYNMLNFKATTTQLAKASLAIRTKLQMPDIIGVEEVETQAALDALAIQINTDATGNPATPYVAMVQDIGSQDVGFLYRADRVSNPTFSALADGTTKMGGTCTTYTVWDRPPYAMDATVNVPGRSPVPITVIVNHLRSMLSVELDNNTGLCTRLKRAMEAEQLAAILNTLQASGKKVVTVGDFNALDVNDGYVDVLGTVIGAPATPDQVTVATVDNLYPNYTALVQSLPDKVLYTYVEGGNAQAIDHIIVNDALLPMVSRVEVAHVNADFPYAPFATDATRAERNSDHDQPVAYFVAPPPELVVTPDNVSKTYGADNPPLTGTITGLLPGDESITATYLTNATLTSGVGTYQIKGKLDDPDNKLSNYVVTYRTGNLTITPAPLTVNVANAAKTYGAANPLFTGTITGILNNDNITATYSTVATAASAVGDFPITATLVDPDGKLANYDVTNTPGTLTITGALLTINVANATRTYGAANPTFTGTITGIQNGDNISATYSTIATTASVVADYAITAAIVDPDGKAANYSVANNPGLLTITPAPLTVTADSKSMTYGGTVPTLTASVTGFVNGETTALLTGAPTLSTTVTSTSDAGAYAIAVGQGTLAAPNYTFVSANGTLTVDPATLTVIANSKTRVFGASNPAFDGSITGLVNGDVITATYTTVATSTSDAGTYPITASLVDAGARLGNYAVTNTPGTLTITAASTTTAIASSKQVLNLPGSLTLTATVTSAGGTPTGTVTFYLGSTSLGTATVDQTGKATLTLASLTAVGKTTVSAVFAGSQNFTTSTSSNLTQYVYGAAPDYTFTATPTALTLRQGQSGTVQITMTPTNGFNGNVTFACSGLATLMTCQFTPSQLTGNVDGNPVTGTLTITTVAPARAVAQTSRSSAPLAMLVFSMSGLGVMGMVVVGERRGKRSKRVLAAIIFGLLLMLLLSSCGSPNSFASPGATPPGTVTTSVVATATAGTTGAAPASHQVQVQITITQ